MLGCKEHLVAVARIRSLMLVHMLSYTADAGGSSGGGVGGGGGCSGSVL